MFQPLITLEFSDSVALKTFPYKESCISSKEHKLCMAVVSMISSSDPGDRVDHPMNFCRFEYRWADGVQIKKPIEVSAPKYVEYLMDWIALQLDDETMFPQKLGIMKSSLTRGKSNLGRKQELTGCCVFQGCPSLPISGRSSRPYSSGSLGSMPTSTTHTFRRLSASRRKLISIPASNISPCLRG